MCLIKNGSSSSAETILLIKLSHANIFIQKTNVFTKYSERDIKPKEIHTQLKWGKLSDGIIIYLYQYEKSTNRRNIKTITTTFIN